MQRPDEKKRREIMTVAAKLFAERPFHAVRLEDIAKKTRLGKGTIYVYFASKEELHSVLVAEALHELTAELRLASKDRSTPSWTTIERLLHSMLAFAERFPHIYTLMRTNVPDARIVAERESLVAAITAVLRRGRRRGELRDAHPELTAEFLLAFVRAALLAKPGRLSHRAIARHALGVLGHGILARRSR